MEYLSKRGTLALDLARSLSVSIEGGNRALPGTSCDGTDDEKNEEVEVLSEALLVDKKTSGETGGFAGERGVVVVVTSSEIRSGQARLRVLRSQVSMFLKWESFGKSHTQYHGHRRYKPFEVVQNRSLSWFFSKL